MPDSRACQASMSTRICGSCMLALARLLARVFEKSSRDLNRRSVVNFAILVFNLIVASVHLPVQYEISNCGWKALTDGPTPSIQFLGRICSCGQITPCSIVHNGPLHLNDSFPKRSPTYISGLCEYGKCCDPFKYSVIMHRLVDIHIVGRSRYQVCTISD